MIEVRRRLFGDRGQHAEAHQDVPLGIEQHDLLVRTRQSETEAEPGMAAHRRIADLDIELVVVAQIDPVPAAASGNEDRIAAVMGDGLHHVDGVHHGKSLPLGRIVPLYPLGSHCERQRRHLGGPVRPLGLPRRCAPRNDGQAGVQRLKPWYSSPTRITTGRWVRSASSKATSMRAQSASFSTR